MKPLNHVKHFLIVFAAGAALTLPLASWSRRALADEPKETKGTKSELRNQMEDMDDDFKKLKRTCRKAEQNEQSLKLLTAIQQRCVTCKELTPERAAKVPEADRAKFVKEYRREMAPGTTDFCKMS